MQLAIGFYKLKRGDVCDGILAARGVQVGSAGIGLSMVWRDSGEDYADKEQDQTQHDPDRPEDIF